MTDRGNPARILGQRGVGKGSGMELTSLISLLPLRDGENYSAWSWDILVYMLTRTVDGISQSSFFSTSQ